MARLANFLLDACCLVAELLLARCFEDAYSLLAPC